MKVNKRKGGLEDWDKDKLVLSMTNAGLNQDEARCIATLIETRIENKVPEPVDSEYIRNCVIGILKAVGSNVAYIYENFSK